MIPVLSRAQMRAFDEHAIRQCRVPSLVLMENAGRGAAEIIERELFAGRAHGRRAVVVSGAGNNGGDGFVVARHLLTRGAEVEVWLAGDLARMTPDCRANHDAFTGIGGAVTSVPLGGALDEVGASFARADVVVDALFGTGLHRPIVPPYADVVRLMNEARASAPTRIAALDLPSGLDADTGAALGAAVEADLTISFSHLKLGHVTGHGASAAGPVHVVDIGVPPSLREEHAAELVETSDARAVLRARAVDTHKYRAGHVALLAGSPGKTGAALLAAEGALRAGAGAATIVTWPDAADVLEARIAEVMVARIEGGAPSEAALARSLDALLAGKRSVVLGPGFGTGARARAAAGHVVSAFSGPIVGDADVFTIYEGAPEELAVAEGRLVLTPHAGELGRLLGRSSREVEANRFEAAKEAAARANAVVLLKGAYTVVAAPDGRVVVSGSGVPALATAGSGDVLSGVLGALVCSLPPFEAAWCGAFVHGAAGAAWQKEHGDRGLLAGEIARGLPDVLAALLASR